MELGLVIGFDTAAYSLQLQADTVLRVAALWVVPTASPSASRSVAFGKLSGLISGTREFFNLFTAQGFSPSGINQMLGEYGELPET